MRCAQDPYEGGGIQWSTANVNAFLLKLATIEKQQLSIW